MKSGDTDAAEWLKFQAFTTAVVEDEKLRLKIKKGIAQALERGETKKQFLNDLPKVLNEFKSKLKTTFETNQALAFGAAQQAKLIEVSEDFPYWKYSAMHDAHTRPDHAALDGKIFESTDHRFYPPIGYNCRCTAIPLTAAQAGRTDQNQFMHPKQELKQPIASAEFVGNKQKNFVKWLEKRAETAEPETKALLEKAAERILKQVENPLVMISDKIYHEKGAEKESEFKNNLEVARVLANKWKTNITLITPNPLLPFNHDSIIFNKKFDFKDSSTGNWRTLSKDWQKAKKQAPNIVLRAKGQNISADVIIQAFEDRMLKSKNWKTLTIIKEDRIFMIKNKSYKWSKTRQKIRQLFY